MEDFLFHEHAKEVDVGLEWHNLVTSQSLLESSHVKYKRNDSCKLRSRRRFVVAPRVKMCINIQQPLWSWMVNKWNMVTWIELRWSAFPNKVTRNLCSHCAHSLAYEPFDGSALIWHCFAKHQAMYIDMWIQKWSTSSVDIIRWSNTTTNVINCFWRKGALKNIPSHTSAIEDWTKAFLLRMKHEVILCIQEVLYC